MSVGSCNRYNLQNFGLFVNVEIVGRRKIGQSSKEILEFINGQSGIVNALTGLWRGAVTK